MTGLIIQYAPIWIPMLLQTWALFYRLGKMEQRLMDHEHRIRRLEKFQDARFAHQER